ncbi:protein phosphatase 2C domain-containing protein [Streptomyces sp. NPDC001046]|uniref:protein phosphatase 2C domain-containing protein n=1 Tax=Streptomyces sp. NPDC001046 TaxID=3364543 RepID=UPI0036910317
MSQQGGRPTGHEDDWWRQLYEDSTDDTGPAPAPDSLDDRFASAAGAVTGPPVVPSPRAGADDLPAPPRAPWEPPPSRPPGPVTFPTAGHQQDPTEPAAASGDPTSAAPPPAAAPPASPAPQPAAPPEQAPAAPPPAPGMPSAPPPPAAPPAWPARAGHPPTVADTPSVPPPPADPPSARPEQPGPVPPPAPAASQGSVPPPAPPVSQGSVPPPAPPEPRSPLSPSAPPQPQGPGSVPSPPGTPGPGSVAPQPEPPGPGSPAEPYRAVGTVSVPPVPAEPPPDAVVAQREPRIERPAGTPGPRGHVGSRPPTYDAEPTALPAADPDDLGDLVADTVLDGARYGTCTLRAVSVRGDSARYRGEPRRDSLLTARFGTGEQALLLVAMATGARATPGAHRAAAEACHWIGRAVGRSHARLVEDIRGGRRGDLKSGLHRLTDRSLGRLRAGAGERGVAPEEYAASLRCLLLPADPACRTRVFFGVGPGGLFRLREGQWQDIEPQVADVRGEAVLGFGSPPSQTPEGDRLTMDLGLPTPPSPYEPAPEPPREPFRFRTSVARPGDTLLMCSGGLADPLRGEPELGEYLAERWSLPEPPGLAAFLADSQVRVKGYADDRTAAAVWEA